MRILQSSPVPTLLLFSTPYLSAGHVEEVLLAKNFFPIVDACLSCEDSAPQICAMVRRWRFFATFLLPEFQASCVQHISYLHSKFALRPHHVYTNMVDIHPAAAEIRRGEKKKKNERNHRAKI